MQSLNSKPNLIIGFSSVVVNADPRQSLEFMLVDAKKAVRGNCGSRSTPQSRRLLREFDEGEDPISFNAHEAYFIAADSSDNPACDAGLSDVAVVMLRRG